MEELVAIDVASIVVLSISFIVLKLSELKLLLAIVADALDDLVMIFCGSYLNTLLDDVVDVTDEGV